MPCLGMGAIGVARRVLLSARAFVVVLVVGVVPVVCAPPAWAASSHTAYVADFEEGIVIPIDTAANTAGTPIPVGSGPSSGPVAVAITPDGKTAYVTNSLDGTVTPIATATNTAGTAISVGFEPIAIAITPDGKTAYVVSPSASGPGFPGSVIPIDTATNTAGTAIPVGASPAGIAITPDGKTAYVTNELDGTVTPIATATNTAGTTISAGSLPLNVAITPDGKTAYITDNGSNSVTPIDTATNTAGTAIAVGNQPSGIAVTPDGKTAYVANSGSGSVTPIDTATNTAGTAIAVASGPDGIAVTPDGKTAYVTNNGSASVTPIDTATNTAGTAIPVGGASSAPVGVAISPDQGPVAAFLVTPASAGHASSFDATSSSDADGSVASYHWDFGDGSTQTTTSATTTHTYATAATYTVTLTVTDDAGCSTGVVFTGQTVGCHGSAAAQVSHQPMVSAASPALTLSAPSSGTAGTAISASSISVSLSGGASATGSITFEVFGPQSSAPSDCSTGGTTVGAASVSGDGSYSPSAGFTPSHAGDYWWYASYAGDSNNHAANSGCGGAMAETIVGQASPSLGAVGAPGSGTAGTKIDAPSVSSALSGSASGTGTISFVVFGPLASAPSNCLSGGTPVGTASVSGDGTYKPNADFTPSQAGDYWWYASYGGDSNNNAVNSGCGGGMTETVVAADTSLPHISIFTPAGHGPYAQYQLVHARYSCTDPDLATCSGPVPSGNYFPTRTVGLHSFTVSATDTQGNHASRTRSYTVFAPDGSGQMAASPASVSASSAQHTLTFSYQAANGGIWHGALSLFVPTGWSAPSTNPAAPGYVTASEGKVTTAGRTITVSIPILASLHTMTITYGSMAHGGPGATSPSTTGTHPWVAHEKSVPHGALTHLLTSPQITVSPR
jgi:YVTN family beta-propeller protein